MTSAKAWVAAILSTLLAGATALGTVLTGDATLHDITQGQWLVVIIAMLTTGGSVFGVTYAVTNKPGEPTESQAALILDKYTAPVQSGGQGNGDLSSQ
jgi:hypothetical protein